MFEQHHYEAIADVLALTRARKAQRDAFAAYFAADNPRFKKSLFMERSASYRVVRFYKDDEHPQHRMIVKRGLTLYLARQHCDNPDTHTADWFDGYEKEPAR